MSAPSDAMSLPLRFSDTGERLATGKKYRCREVRVYLEECGEKLGRDPLKDGSSKSLVLMSFSGD